MDKKLANYFKKCYISQKITSAFYFPFLPGPFRDCYEAHDAGHSTSGMFLIKPDEMERQMQVWCEQEIDNGGWTVIQTRRDGSVNFFRNWDNYKVTIAGLLILLCSISVPLAHPSDSKAPSILNLLELP